MTPSDDLALALATYARHRFGRLPGRHALALEVGGQRFGRAEDSPFPAASLIKLPLLVLALRSAEEGELDLDERVPLTAEHHASGSGLLQDLDQRLDHPATLATARFARDVVQLAQARSPATLG